MKKRLFLILLLIPIFSYSDSVSDAKKNFKNAVKNQRKSDLDKKDAIIKKMNYFIKEINGDFKQWKSKTKIDTPISIDKIDDIKKQKHNHSPFKRKRKYYMYTTVKHLNLRSEPISSSQKIGFANLGEKVQIIAKSKNLETINGKKNHWIMIRKKNKDEGWCFGSFLSKTKLKKNKKVIKNTNFGKMRIPTEGRISSKFGYRVHPVTKRRGSFHKGIDIAAPIGTIVKASATGKIKISKYTRGGYGNLIVIEHEKNLSTYYGHLSKREVKIGKTVQAGEEIGKVGTTGRSTGPHLHFEVRRGRTALNPNQLLQ